MNFPSGELRRNGSMIADNLHMIIHTSCILAVLVVSTACFIAIVKTFM